MEIGIGLGVLALLLATFILPWVNRSRIARLQSEVRTLRAHLNGILTALSDRGIEVTPHTVTTPLEKPVTSAPVSPEIYQPKPAAAKPTPAPEIITASPVTKEAPKPKKEKAGFEHQFGARLPVWIGGIALAFAGFYMVKYSIESGLLTEGVRVMLGGLFGLALLAVANWIRSKPTFANGTRISQALSGAGIADLYVTFFAAANLYHLISPVTAFIGMAVVTGVAVILSLRHGAPIALLGLLGGFLTPVLVGSTEPNTPLLFIYLYAVTSGLMVIIRRQRWWWMTIPTILGAFLWVVLWLFADAQPGDAMWVGLFLIAISATVVTQSRRDMAAGNLGTAHYFSFASILNYFSLGGACLLMGIVAYHSGFTLLEWSFFGLLAAGAIALAWLNYTLYWFAPWLALAVNIVMLASWNAPSHGDFILVLSSFAALYIIASTILTFKSHKPVAWAGLTTAAAFGYYLTAYKTFQTVTDPNLHIWGFLAMGIALASVALTRSAISRFSGDEITRQRILAIFALTVTAFAGIGATIELPREFLSIAFAFEILAVCWINLRVNIRALRYFAVALAFVFAAIILPQLMLLAQLAVYSVTEVDWQATGSIPVASWPLFQLGLPALLFAASSYLLRLKQDDLIVRGFECATITLLTIMGYYLLRQSFHTNEDIISTFAGFTERGLITVSFFAFSFVCLYVGRTFSRRAVSYSAVVLALIAIARTIIFDLILYNPLISHQDVGATPILNSLIITYAVPAAFLLALSRELPPLGLARFSKYVSALTLVLAFSFITFEVSQFYHGQYLGEGEITNAEIYTYSVAWLALGIALLFYGTLKHDRLIRIASLAIMILTVGKVFLYDASELTGLLRVFSFLGLGISLIGLSYFYTRFIFGNEKPNE